MSKLRQLFINSVLIGTSLLFTWAVAEGFLRAVLFVEELPSLGLREPWRYAADLDDDYWKLAYIFEGERKGETVGFFNSELGWDTQPTTDSPLGARTAAFFAVQDLIEPILFYGDSFVGGKHNIPDKLDALLPDRSVLNLGVGGYGVDQIFLKFSKTVQYFENPLVLIGLLTYDLDRSVLGIRGKQKPYFDLENGKLKLRNTPVLPTTKEYIDNNPIDINSYFLRFVLFRARNLIPPERFNRLLGYTEKEEKKRSVNRAILQSLKEKAVELNLQPYAVIFYAGEEIRQPTWREKFLKQNLKRLDIRFFDTRQYLLNYMSTTGTPLEELYDDDFGHLNQTGRLVVAKGLAEWIDTFS